MTAHPPRAEPDRSRSVLVQHVGRVLGAAAANRRPVMLAVCGDAGHGKSTVLDTVRRHLYTLGVPLLAMNGSAVTTDMPYAALYEMLVHDHEQPPPPALVSELASFRPSTSPLAVSAAVSAWLNDRSRGHPLAVMVDDADLVDDDSLRVLAYAVARDASGSISMLHTITRPVALLDRLLVQQFLLDDLGEEGALQVALAAGATDRDAADLVEQFGGNPLALVHGGSAHGQRAADGRAPVSPRLVEDVNQRVEALHPDTARLLESAAITRLTALADLARMAHPVERSVDAIADEIEDVGLGEIDQGVVRWRRRWMCAAMAARCPPQRRRRWTVRAGMLHHPSNGAEQTGRRVPELTNGELRVVHVIVSGANTREAAARLHVSHKTVESHLQSVYRKLDVHSRVQLAAVAHSNGLLDTPEPAGTVAGR